MKFAIRNRWTGSVQFEAEIEADENTPLRVKVGLAACWAWKRGADLRDADLRGADLRSFKADFWMILTQNPNEVDGFMAALREGRVNGSTYHGECACLVGTIANVRQVPVEDFERDSNRPAEQWFLMIRTGDQPGDNSGGGFAAGKALEWAEEWQACQRSSAAA